MYNLLLTFIAKYSNGWLFDCNCLEMNSGRMYYWLVFLQFPKIKHSFTLSYVTDTPDTRHAFICISYLSVEKTKRLRQGIGESVHPLGLCAPGSRTLFKNSPHSSVSLSVVLIIGAWNKRTCSCISRKPVCCRLLGTLICPEFGSSQKFCTGYQVVCWFKMVVEMYK